MSRVAGARAAGASIGPGWARTYWGGYSGIFIGHPWEVAHNPGWFLADNCSVHLPGRDGRFGESADRLGWGLIPD